MEKYKGFVDDSAWVDWNPDPEIFRIPGTDHPVVWYGLFFALAFVGSHVVMNKIFKTENRTAKELDRLTLYVIVGTVLGARLGHCLFYGPLWDGPNGEVGYLSHPLNILKVWEGGLASHGGAIGILLALILYSRKTKESIWWILDRIVVVVALSSTFIRMGNLMNSEIIGKITNSPFGFRFIQHDIEINYGGVNTFMKQPDDVRAMFIQSIPARHPSQLYEGLFYLILFASFFFLWKKKKNTWPKGFMFGLYITLMFLFRFLIEFTKEVQVDWESGKLLDMGQMLSIPFVLAGIAIMIIAKKKNQLHALRPEPVK
ncbi:MAG: prolipoprotein diacylglyceryl transferase [Bacteroidia bacterium]|nr:prolipoprotein diacylglyceryl transferase [Bacteroidia bacterium]